MFGGSSARTRVPGGKVELCVLEFRVQGSGSLVQSFGFWVFDFGFRV